MTSRGEKGYFSRYLPDNLPSDWDECKLSAICTLKNGESLPTDERQGGSVPVFGSNGAVGSHSESNTSSPMLTVGRKGSAGAVNYSKDPGFVIDTAYYIDQPSLDCDLRWLYYVLQSLELEQNAEHSAVPGINRRFVEEHRVPLPDRRTQEKVATFLKKEESKIENWIDALHDLDVLIKERKNRQIFDEIINNQAYRTKPSSKISWISEIPEEHSETKLKYVVNSVIDSEHKTAPKRDGEYHIIRTSDVRNGKINIEDSQTTSKEIYKEWTSRGTPKPNDIILTREAPAGEVGIIPENFDVLLGQRTVLLKVDEDKARPEYLNYYLQSDIVDWFINISSQGSTVEHLNVSDLKEIPVIIPDLDVQDRIVQNLHEVETRTEKLSNSICEAKSLLNEKRQALITAAVTGQIDVSKERDEAQASP